MQQSLLDRDELKATLLEHSQMHFAQAEGSPFTTGPLSHLLKYDGLTPFADCLIQGCLATNLYHFDEPTRAILNNLKCKVPLQSETTTTLTHSTLLNGIKNDQKEPRCPCLAVIWGYTKHWESMLWRKRKWI